MKKVTTGFLVLLAAMAAADSKWQLEPAADGNAAYSLQQVSASGVRNESASGEVLPVLSFHCSPQEQQVMASIDWQRFISSFSTEVGFKVDDGRFTWLKWKIDPSEKITLSPSADDTGKLLAALASGERLLVEISPYSESPVTASFALSGLQDGLLALKKECS